MTDRPTAKCSNCGTFNETTPDHNFRRTCWKCGGDLPGEDLPLVKHAALCVPMYRDLCYETFDCIDRLRSMPPPAGWAPINFQPGKGHPTALTRESICENLLRLEKENALRHEILLWLDSDNGMKEPERLWDLVLRLDAAPPRVALLGVPCRKRGFPAGEPNIVPYMRDGAPLDALLRAGDDANLPTHYMRASVRRPFVLVERVGFGVLAMRRSVLDVIDRPWFDTPWLPGSGGLRERYLGEDFYFCDQVRKKGLLVAVDFMLSRGTWHLFEDKQELPDQSTLPWNPDVSWKEV